MSSSLVVPLLIVGFAVANSFSENRHRAPIFEVCCEFEPFMAAPEDEKMKECISEILGDPKSMNHSNPPTDQELEELAEKIACIEECTAKKYELLDSDGNIVLAKLLEVAQGKINGTFMENHIEEAAKKCIEDIEKEIPKESKCNPKPLFLSNCLFFRSLENCPADQVKDKAKCETMIDEIKNGKFPHHFDPPPPEN
ncbi:uncharacterized protein LOC108742071 [Agrilus planipennis]|uniref:Uncharacterized protein LOC108742071 n=1 Tax=Agrilus planipennis TaxID=224129 RepID=A0A1W4X974_AGRPL|nr:uncharacterized protein LOC108742071 [Agrilus planipennis]